MEERKRQMILTLTRWNAFGACQLFKTLKIGGDTSFITAGICQHPYYKNSSIKKMIFHSIDNK